VSNKQLNHTIPNRIASHRIASRRIVSISTMPPSPARTKSGSSPGKTSDGKAVGILQEELNENNVKHREELYWLRLELDTTRREKEAVEDRMAALYRDMQEMEESKPSRTRPLTVDAKYVVQLQNQLEKYERMMRVMNNQLNLVRNSSDAVVKNLKEEISDIMDEKVKVEINLMNQLASMDKEKQDLKTQLQQQSGSPNTNTTSPSRRGGGSSQGSNSNNNSDEKLQAQVKHLLDENNKLTNDAAQQRKESLAKGDQTRQEKDALSRQVKKLQGDMLMMRSTDEAVQAMDQMKHDRNETLYTLERVALLWDRADESIQKLESVMMELKPNDEHQDDNREQLLSTLETASLVHGQAKVSLMLIELKLRNNLACTKNDQLQLGSLTLADPAVNTRISDIQTEAMSAIEEVQAMLNKEIEGLGEQAALETKVIKETLESKVTALKIMEARQQHLEQEISALQTAEGQDVGGMKDGMDANAMELYVSQKGLERLQAEVLQVIDRVKEKNESIGRLTATVEEHKVRERTLMEELRRFMKEQSDRESAERQRRMEIQNDDDDVEEEEVEDDSYSDDSTEYDEQTLEDFVPANAS
jgi:chromosome segregation ATPase